MVSFYAGTILILLPINLFLMFYDFPDDDREHKAFSDWDNITQLYRSFFFLSLIVFGTSAATKILEIYKINYIHIFEINYY